MKTLNIILRNTAGILILSVLVLNFSACWEEGEDPEFSLFGAEYNPDLPPGINPEPVEQLVTNQDVQITGSAVTFTYDNNLDNALYNNDIQVFGDLSTANSSILITMNRPYQQDPEYAHAVIIEVVGPFNINTPTSAGFGEIYMGDPTSNGMVLTSENRPDTYFKFTLTEWDAENKELKAALNTWLKIIMLVSAVLCLTGLLTGAINLKPIC